MCKTRLLISIICSALFIQGCLVRNSDVEPEPIAVLPKDVKSILNDIPSYTRFSFTSLSFFNRQLYVGTNVGLLEFQNDRLIRLNKWNDRGDVIDNVLGDTSTESLWLYHSGIGRFVRFDGARWDFVELPIPESGHYTRGDALRGVSFLGNIRGLWMQRGDHPWRWDNDKKGWSPVAIPALQCTFVVDDDVYDDIGCFSTVAPFGSTEFVIMHRRFVDQIDFSNKSYLSTFPSDSVFYQKNGSWDTLSTETFKSLITKNVVISNDAAFIQSFDDSLFRLSDLQITSIETLGEIDAMTTTTQGNLLVSFRNLGIYEYNNGWVKKFDCPYPSTEPEHFAQIAEDNGQVALAISAKPFGPGPDFQYLGQTALWISDESKMKRIPFPQ
ncbi:MAG: hypothetical protein ACKVRN_01295 [Pyrinomonadaceae bacterium]